MRYNTRATLTPRKGCGVADGSQWVPLTVPIELGYGMEIALTTDPQKIYDLSLPEGIDASELHEMAEFMDSLVPEVEKEWQEFPPRVQDALMELARRENLDAADRQSFNDLPRTDKRAVDAFLDALRSLREATLDAIERERSRGPFREYTDEQIGRWDEADKLPPDLAEWIKATVR